jgi:hypothetical protein
MKLNTKILYFLTFIIFALIARFVESIPNFSSFLALALFAGILFPKNKLSYLFPFAVQLGIDLTVGLFAYDFKSILIHFMTMYSSLAILVFAGSLVSKKVNYVNSILGILSGSLAFFLITNLGSWILMPQYSADFSGLLASYSAAIPFFKNSIISGLLFSTIMYLSYKVLETRIAKEAKA